MKSLLILGLASLLLAGCTSNNETTTTSSSSETTTSSLTPEQEKLNKEIKDALNNEDAVFPQLSTEVADDEAAVKLVTSEGDITLKLFPKLAPLAVENFLTHAKEGYFDGLTFHRVINNFMIQGGDPKGDGTGGESIWAGKDTSIDSGNGFANEFSPYLYNLRGALAMANAGPDTNGSQFFINQNPADVSNQLDPKGYPKKIYQAYANGGNPSLDGGYTVFGQVTEGMDIVDKIAATETDSNDKPTTPITINSVEIVKDYSFE